MGVLLSFTRHLFASNVFDVHTHRGINSRLSTISWRLPSLAKFGNLPPPPLRPNELRNFTAKLPHNKTKLSTARGICYVKLLRHAAILFFHRLVNIRQSRIPESGFPMAFHVQWLYVVATVFSGWPLLLARSDFIRTPVIVLQRKSYRL